MKKTKCIVDQFHFENDAFQFLDVAIHLEGYIELDMETSIKYAIDDQAEIDLIYQKLTEALKSAKQQAKARNKSTK
jgi:predicted 3-demethylubiquinone-9 3-methyltransferase (glyoxalase superfamily)